MSQVVRVADNGHAAEWPVTTWLLCRGLEGALDLSVTGAQPVAERREHGRYDNPDQLAQAVFTRYLGRTVQHLRDRGEHVPDELSA